MSKPLPTHDFEWMESSELENWRNHSCILEVDLEYPRNLYDSHSDYPLAPVQIKVSKVKNLFPFKKIGKGIYSTMKTSNSILV